jgi:hypothetical protein
MRAGNDLDAWRSLQPGSHRSLHMHPACRNSALLSQLDCLCQALLRWQLFGEGAGRPTSHPAYRHLWRSFVTCTLIGPMRERRNQTRSSAGPNVQRPYVSAQTGWFQITAAR